MATRTGDGDIGSGLKYDVLKRLVLANAVEIAGHYALARSFYF